MIPGFSSRFECKVDGVDETLTVLDFEYEVKLSELYICKIEFISMDPDLDYWSFVDKNATLIINVKGASELQHVNGIVTEFIQRGQVGKGYSYEMILEPHFSQLKHQEQTEVFLSQSIPEIVETQLRHSHIKFRSELSQDYSKRPFVCQFQETDFNFISRWLEHEGIYYYFEQGTDSETLVLTDRYSTHKDHQHFSELIYNPNNVTSTAESSYIVEQFTSHISKVANTLELKGYNYDDDTNTIVTKAVVSQHGMGNIEIYDENVMDEKDAKRIAEIRAQEINCKEQVYLGTTLASNIVPGYRFKLSNHFREANNQEYLVFDVHQNGSQRQIALAHLGLQNSKNEKDEKIVFITEFKAIPGKIQFRAPSNTPAKKIDGIIPAVLDAETSGEYAQLDNQGRYKIRLLHSDKADGQASDWVRKMESYIGNEYGHHFPMHKNTEICLAFQFGNPDRPVIMGGVHNSSNKNVVNDKNQKTSVTKSAGGNMMIMGDQKGQEYTHIYSPSGNTSHILGNVGAALLTSDNPLDDAIKHPWAKTENWPSNYPTPNPHKCRDWSYNEGDTASQIHGDSYSYTSGTSYSYQAGTANSTVQGDKNYTTYGNQHTIAKGNVTSEMYGNSNSTTHGNKVDKFMGASETFKFANDFAISLSGKEEFTLGALKSSFEALGANISTSHNLLRVDITGGVQKVEYNSYVNTKKLFDKGSVSTTAVGPISYTSAIKTTLKAGLTELDLSTAGSASLSVNPTTSIDLNSLGITIKCGTSSITVNQFGVTLKAGINTLALKSTTGLSVDCGGSSLSLSPTMISGKAPLVKMNDITSMG
ncbi:type VI secretion system tip protein VgrG [Francisellaceae bacterium]|nr:type VI secretion system tip protein VgrG [Francisellaceae bacterium]